MIGCVVLNYNDYKTTTDFVLRVKEMKSIDLIVVVDNYSTDDSFHQLLSLESEKVHVIQSSKNGGYGYGNNVGIEYLKGKVDYILIANPDVEFIRQYLFFYHKKGTLHTIYFHNTFF